MLIYSPKDQTAYTPNQVVYDPAAMYHWDAIRQRHGWEDTEDFDLADHANTLTLEDWRLLTDDPHARVITYDLEGAVAAERKAVLEADRARFNRDQTIRLALQDGLSLRDVAALTGLSHTAIANIRDRDPDTFGF